MLTFLNKLGIIIVSVFSNLAWNYKTKLNKCTENVVAVKNIGNIIFKLKYISVI